MEKLIPLVIMGLGVYIGSLTGNVGALILIVIGAAYVAQEYLTKDEETKE